MKTNERINQILKALNDNRSKLSALYSLYNTSLLQAENERASITEYYQQMVDFKNDLNSLQSQIYNVKKTERASALTKNQSKIKHINLDMISTNKNFKDSCNQYKLALQDCGSLKTEYTHEVSALCKEFKGLYAEKEKDIDPIFVKGYKQQVKVIKSILAKIDMLIADYNVKKNKLEQDDNSFTQLFDSANQLLERLKSIA